MIQHIKEVTRVRGKEMGNVLDLVLTDDDMLVEDIEMGTPLGESDHACIIFNVI